MHPETCRADTAPVVVAPDGSAVGILCGVTRGGMAVFTLPGWAVSRAVAHRTVEEVWYVVSGSGRMWRRLGDWDSVTDLAPGTSLSRPSGTRFQFRSDSGEPLVAVGVTMPPWPGEGEAVPVEGIWPPTV